jgi:diguanylate cyclase (GGDEF)-like protein
MPLSKNIFSEVYFSRISALCFGLIAIIGVIDYSIGPEISTALFYVLPIGAGAWYDSRISGYVLSFIAAIVWLITDYITGQQYSSHAILFWNAFVRLALFIIISHLMASYRSQLKKEEGEADTDSLTGAYNTRGFYVRAEEERLRFQRFLRPFTVAYVDLDNFKKVNDTEGHRVGDEVLRQVVSAAKAFSRKNDLVARLGGDEFAFLFVETGFAEAGAAMSKIRSSMLQVMQTNNWPVTFSVGMVTYSKVPESVEQMVKLADDLMYLVKKNSKNDVYHIEWLGAAAGQTTSTESEISSPAPQERDV